ncbi:MAG: Holliday junction branch migration protein RuvA [Dehalococcoidia bacterium]|nr:Holliday junction branch migration protein RuvA [Dehalococcoidia bacterium]
MIASIRGIIEAVAIDHAVIIVGGVGLQVFMPTTTLSALGSTGAPVHLLTQMVVREDAIMLFGFGAEEELELFRLLQGVSGFGPKLALTLLSALSAEELASAIAGGNMELLTSVPGVGKKLAGRLILELKDKVAIWATGGGTSSDQGDNDVIAALMSLGYSATEASRAVASVPHETKFSVEDKIKLALGYFEKK